MQELIDKLLKVDFSQVPLFVTDTLRNPSSNPTAFVLLIAAATIVLALIIILVVIFFMAGSDEDEEFDEELPADEPAAVAVAAAATATAAAPPEVVEHEEDMFDRIEQAFSRLPRVAVIAIWLVLFGAVWVAGGFVSRTDTVCLSCHQVDAPHINRTDDSSATVDTHAVVRCASCHETSSELLSVTTAVPGRAAHFVAGAIDPDWAGSYGVPVANKDCTRCHEEGIEGTRVNQDRGIRMSHVEPLEAKALCTDCHKPLPGTGVVNNYTVGMETCLRCHDAQVASAECEFCHVRDVGFAVQTRGTFKSRSHTSILDCYTCHDPKPCDSCHGIRMPHSIAFLGTGHARPAVEDIWYNQGQVCQRCHTNKRRPCARCHQGPFPGHAPSYMIDGHKTADPFNNGCDGCHGYRAWVVGRNFCGNCHPQWRAPLQ